MDSPVKKSILILCHMLFWGIQFYLIFFAYENLSWNGFSTENGLLHWASFYGILTNMVIFYIQYSWLNPKFFIAKRYTSYLILSTLFFLLVTGIESFIDYKVIVTNDIHTIEETSLFGLVLSWIFSNAILNLLFGVFGFLSRFQLEYVKSEKMKHELLKTTHATELKYLKAQLNPHFLFNGINSVYHLIGKNNPLAKNTLLQFSNLLRYQLYESNTTQISLSKELDYITQYIEIEKIRKGDDITLSYSITMENGELLIAPLMLIPFVENAFKHVSNADKSEDNQITIQIAEKEGMLHCIIENTFDDFKSHTNYGGIGLQNIKRRLAILYPNRHRLTIQHEDSYRVTLQIKL
ncbi:sensor histidine kinase [Aquimarina rhabdastrellae]